MATLESTILLATYPSSLLHPLPSLIKPAPLPSPPSTSTTFQTLDLALGSLSRKFSEVDYATIHEAAVNADTTVSALASRKSSNKKSRTSSTNKKNPSSSNYPTQFDPSLYPDVDLTQSSLLLRSKSPYNLPTSLHPYITLDYDLWLPPSIGLLWNVGADGDGGACKLWKDDNLVFRVNHINEYVARWTGGEVREGGSGERDCVVYDLRVGKEGRRTSRARVYRVRVWVKVEYNAVKPRFMKHPCVRTLPGRVNCNRVYGDYGFIGCTLQRGEVGEGEREGVMIFNLWRINNGINWTVEETVGTWRGGIFGRANEGLGGGKRLGCGIGGVRLALGCLGGNRFVWEGIEGVSRGVQIQALEEVSGGNTGDWGSD